MKKMIMADFVEYNDKTSKLGNYHYCNCFVNDGYEALWMSNSFNPLIYFKDKEDYAFKKRISTPQRHELAPNIYGYSAFSWRLYGNYLFSRNPKIVLQNEKYIRPNPLHTFHKMQFDEVDTLWISNPKLYWLTNVVRYNRLIYRIADDYAQFKEFPNIERVEQRLIEKADHVFVTSSRLREKVLRHGKQPHILNNGVQFEHFAHHRSEQPAEYQASEQLKIVYVGAIKYWFDVELVERLAKEVTADIYLIGKAEIDLSRIAALSNVHVLGAKAYDTIPSYLKYADVAIIPFVKSKATDAVSPIKLYEYCSAGIAVVASNMEEVKKMNAPVDVAEDHDDFIRRVKRYLHEGYDQAPLIEFGRRNSWSSRYQFVQHVVTKPSVAGPSPAAVYQLN